MGTLVLNLSNCPIPSPGGGADGMSNFGAAVQAAVAALMPCSLGVAMSIEQVGSLAGVSNFCSILSAWPHSPLPETVGTALMSCLLGCSGLRRTWWLTVQLSVGLLVLPAQSAAAVRRQGTRCRWDGLCLTQHCSGACSSTCGRCAQARIQRRGGCAQLRCRWQRGHRSFWMRPACGRGSSTALGSPTCRQAVLVAWHSLAEPAFSTHWPLSALQQLP